MDKRKAELITSLFLILISIFILVNDNLVQGGVETDLGSMFLPRFIAIVIILFSTAIGFKSFKEILKEKKASGDDLISLEGYSGIFLYLGAVFMYWLIMPYIGFMLSTVLVMAFVSFLLGGRNWLVIIIMSLVVSISIDYGSKEFLHVYLPAWNLF